MKTLIDILRDNSSESLESLQPLSSELLYLKYGKNLVFGESKSGKTYTVIKSLVEAGFKDQVVHVDFDSNRDEALHALGVETYHVNLPKVFINHIFNENDVGNFDLSESLRDKIFVVDSLQDLSPEEGIDTNKGALNAIRAMNVFSCTGATIILIHHATTDARGKSKVKGNSSVIMSKCDTTIQFQKISNEKRIMTVLNTRSEDKIPSGSKKVYETYGNASTKKRINSRVPS